MVDLTYEVQIMYIQARIILRMIISSFVNTYKINKSIEEKDKNIMTLNEDDEKSLEIQHRRLGHYCLENINKYFKFTSNKSS